MSVGDLAWPGLERARPWGCVFVPWPSDQCPRLAPSPASCQSPLIDPSGGARTHRALHEWYRIWANPQSGTWLEP